MRVLLAAFFAASFLVSMNATAFAQIANSSGGFSPSFRLGEGKEYTDEEKERMKANEDAAKAARAKLPDAKVSSDPWASARTADTAAPKKPKAPAKQ